jgi:hypothetical protein
VKIQCRLEKYDASAPMHPFQVLEDEYPERPQMRIRFYLPERIGIGRIQMVYPRHGDVFTSGLYCRIDVLVIG